MLSLHLSQRLAGHILIKDEARALVRLTTRDAEVLAPQAHLAPLFPALAGGARRRC